MWAKSISSKLNIGTQTRKISFHSKSFKKIVKNVFKKLLIIKRDRNMHLFHFYSCSSNWFACHFLVHFLKLFNRFEISMKFCVLVHFPMFSPKILWRSYLYKHFCKLWRKTRNKRLKNWKTSWNSILHPSQSLCYFLFFKKVKFVVPYLWTGFLLLPVMPVGSARGKNCRF